MCNSYVWLHSVWEKCAIVMYGCTEVFHWRSYVNASKLLWNTIGGLDHSICQFHTLKSQKLKTARSYWPIRCRWKQFPMRTFLSDFVIPLTNDIKVQEHSDQLHQSTITFWPITSKYKNILTNTSKYKNILTNYIKVQEHSDQLHQSTRTFRPITSKYKNILTNYIKIQEHSDQYIKVQEDSDQLHQSTRSFWPITSKYKNILTNTSKYKKILTNYIKVQEHSDQLHQNTRTFWPIHQSTRTFWPLK